MNFHLGCDPLHRCCSLCNLSMWLMIHCIHLIVHLNQELCLLKESDSYGISVKLTYVCIEKVRFTLFSILPLDPVGGCVLYFLLNGDLFHTAESGCSVCVPVLVVKVILTPLLLFGLSFPPFLVPISEFKFACWAASLISPLRPSVSIRKAGLSTPLSAVVDELGVEL